MKQKKQVEMNDISFNDLVAMFALPAILATHSNAETSDKKACEIAYDISDVFVKVMEARKTKVSCGD
jgi:hypothetical protein